MNKREYASYLLGRLPEGKLDYVIAYLEGALIPNTNDMLEETEEKNNLIEEADEEIKETTREEDTDNQDFMGDSELTEEMLSGPLASLLRSTRAIQQQSDETDEIYAALERMAALGMDDDLLTGMGSIEGLEGLEELKDEVPAKTQETPKNFFADAGLEGEMMSGPFAAMFNQNQDSDQKSDEDEEEFYSALERMARLELQAYKDGLK